MRRTGRVDLRPSVSHEDLVRHLTGVLTARGARVSRDGDGLCFRGPRIVAMAWNPLLHLRGRLNPAGPDGSVIALDYDVSVTAFMRFNALMLCISTLLAICFPALRLVALILIVNRVLLMFAVPLITPRRFDAFLRRSVGVDVSG